MASAIMGSGQFAFAGIISPIVEIQASTGIAQSTAMTAVMVTALGSIDCGSTRRR